MKTAVVVIDVQNHFVNEFTRSIPGKIAKYLKNNEPQEVFFTRFVNTEDSQFVKRLDWRKCVDRPDTDIHQDLSDLAKSNIFAKPGFSIFTSSKLKRRLKDFDTLQLCGIDSDACVLASAYEAFDRGFGVEILWNLTASHHGRNFDDATRLIIQKNLLKDETP